MASDVNTRQIPVISDIERIKKIVELLEFFGEKVGTILENLPAPQSLTSGGEEKTGSGILEEVLPIATTTKER